VLPEVLARTRAHGGMPMEVCLAWQQQMAVVGVPAAAFGFEVAMESEFGLVLELVVVIHLAVL
jgi:hypothetical protein